MLPMATFCFQCVASSFGMKKINLNYFQDNNLIKLKFGREGILKNFKVLRHCDVKITKRHNTWK